MQVSPKSPKFCIIFIFFAQMTLEDVGQGHPFSIATESYLICIFCANMVKIHQSKIDYAQGQPKFAKPRSNLVILGQTRLELSRRQNFVLWTDRQTDRRRRQQYPFGLKGRGVKKKNGRPESWHMVAHLATHDS